MTEYDHIAAAEAALKRAAQALDLGESASTCVHHILQLAQAHALTAIAKRLCEGHVYVKDANAT